MRVAGDAGKHRKVCGIHMAVRTGGPFPLVDSGIDGEPCVIELRPEPTRSRVAGLACRREGRGNVVGIGGFLIVHLMTGVAIRRRAGVLPADMATCTGYGDVGSRERECRFAVVKRSGLPCCGVVADVALLRKSCLHMVRIRRGVIILQVTGNAVGAEPLVDAVDMARATRDVYVRAREGKQSLAVVKFCARPGNRGVADGTIRGKARLDVIRVGRLLIIRQVARGAILRCPGILAVDVTLRTLDVHMSTGQREACHGVVIELRAEPARRRMAGLARGRKSRLRVRRVGGLLIIRQVA